MEKMRVEIGYNKTITAKSGSLELDATIINKKKCILEIRTHNGFMIIDDLDTLEELFKLFNCIQEEALNYIKE